MQRRQPLPRLWLMTDERQGDGLWEALDRLPRGAGIVFRHYSLPPAERRRLFDAVRRLVSRKRLLLLVAGPPLPGADGLHGPSPSPSRRRLRSASAHDLREIRNAERSGAHLVFVSPVFPTHSHPQGRPLGRSRFGNLVRQARIPVIALGGVDARSGRSLGAAFGTYGWGAIDAWNGQKRKAVPI